MSEPDLSLPVASPPISSSTDAQPQETLLLRGAFDPPLIPGTLGTLDRFEILRLLGEGGMGQVYLAREPRTDTRVAIKIMRPQMADDPQSVHRFLTEARHMYRLSHPRILRVLEVSDRREGPYYVMPYVEGGSLLGQYSPDRPMLAERILAIASQVAEALAHAHAHGLIHRDLKPGNVLLEKDGNAYLTDFGLVRTVFNDSLVDASASHLEGTAPYMSPAVARGEAEDTRCDIYAFGALLYELLTGQPPYTGRTSQIILDQVLKGPPPPLREVNPKASPALVKIAEGCLARELHARYTTMTDVMSDLALAAKGALPLGPHQQEQRRRLPHIAAVLVGTLAVAGLVGVAAHHFSADSSFTAKITGVQSPESDVLAQANTSTANASQSADEPDILDADSEEKMLPAMSALSPTAKVQGPFAYTVTNGAATIVKYTGTGGAVTIPSMLDGIPVTSIGRQAFCGCAELVGVAIPDSVTNIGWSAFSGCTGLTHVTIPASVAFIDVGNFNGCSRLLSIRVDAANTAYSSSADGVLFDKAKTCLVSYPAGKAGSYVIPDGVTSIGASAFKGCTNLASVAIPDTVTRIGRFAFAGCSGLPHVTIPASVTFIVRDSFNSCSRLLSISVEAANPAYCNSADGVLFDKAKTCLVSYPAGKAGSYVIPDGVTSIGAWAFNGCVGLTSVIFPNGLTRIGECAFGGCSGLTRVTIPRGVTSIESWAFQACSSLTRITIPASVTQIGRLPLFDCKSLTGVYFEGDAPPVIEFRYCKPTIYYRPGTKGWGKEFGGRPTAVWDGETGETDDVPPTESSAIPPTAKMQGPFTYTVTNGAVTLVAYTGTGDTVAIPSLLDGLPVTGIGDSAFSGCTNLTRVTIPNSVKGIGLFAFGQCANLSTVSIPSSVTWFGFSFADCSRLTAITVDAANPAYCSSADGVVFNKKMTKLIRCPGGKAGNYVIPNTVTEIGNWAFSGCSRLTHVTIPDSVTDLGEWTFNGCTGLVDVTIPSSVTNIMGWTFAGCAGLTRVTLPDSVTVIDRWAFKNCTGLTSLTIPASVTFIGVGSFNGCSRLLSVMVEAANPAYSSSADGVLFDKAKTCLVSYPAGKAGSYVIPSGVTSIGVSAFSDCGRLTSVVFPNGLTSIGACAFDRCSGLTRVTIPQGVTSIGGWAFQGCSSLTRITIPASVTSIGRLALYRCKNLTGVYFEGDVPPVSEALFFPNSKATIYYRPGAKGWGKTFNGLPTAVWDWEMGEADDALPAEASTIPPTAKVQGPFAYTVTNGAITLTKYTGPGGEVAVPCAINGLSVTVIGDRAFDRCSSLTRVEVPASVKSIGDYAFRACVNLKGVALPESGTFVSTNAFEGCRPGVIDDLYATLQRRGYSRDMHMRPREDPFAQLRKKK